MSLEKPILIVNDNDNLINTMSIILQHKGFSVTTANSGNQDLELIRANQEFGVVLIDIKMPNLNGVETFKLMKEIAPNAIFIMMTAYSVEDLIAEALNAGAYGILHKPFDIGNSIALIDEAFSKENTVVILVASDDSETLFTFRDILERKGYRVTTAEDALHAIEKAQKNTFDVIFLDMMLRATNGFDVFLKMKIILPDAVFVLITCDSDTISELHEQTILGSSFICLQRPLNMSKIVTLLRNIKDGEDHD